VRVAYLGNFRHPHCTEVHVARSLVELDHEVVSLQEDVLGTFQIERAVLDNGCDLLLWTRTWSTRPPLTVDGLDRLRREGVPSAALHLDRLWGLEREHLVHTDPMFRVDVCCTADGGHDREWRRAGVNHRWLRAGVLRAECRMLDPDPRWERYDVAFVGSERYHREWPHRQRLVEHLRRRHGDRFLKVGDGRPTVRGDDLNRLYATVPVIVGDSLLLEGRRSLYWSDRVYETLGRGGLLLHPLVDALVEELGNFAPLSWDPHDDLRQLDDLVDQCLALEPEERWRQRAMAQEHVASYCSYSNRCEELLAHVGEAVRA